MKMEINLEDRNKRILYLLRMFLGTFDTVVSKLNLIEVYWVNIE